MAAIQIEKPPVYGAVKGLTGLAGASPWTQAQRTAGVRREIPLGSTGIGTNRVAPPPIPVVQPSRAALVQALTPGRGGGYDMNSGGGGYNWGSAGWGGAANGGWGRTSTGVRSSAHNADGSWGNSVSNSGNGRWSGWGDMGSVGRAIGSIFGGGGGSSNGGRGGGWGSASEGGMGGRGSFF